MRARTFHARIPVQLCLPNGTGEDVIDEVFGGEYESGYSGERLTVLDIGANVGAFSLWAAHRWPGCTIDAYEPHPDTFAFLAANARAYPMIRCHQLAVYPSDHRKETLFFRGVGDGQAGLVQEIAGTFSRDVMSRGERVAVPVLHPRALPTADIVKIDVEGSEAAIVTHADLSATSLVLLEFQHRRHLDAIKRHLADGFEIAFERREPWSAILAYDEYRPELVGDEYGVVFLVRRGQTRLWHAPLAPGPPDPRAEAEPRPRRSRGIHAFAHRLLRRLTSVARS
jgi:FkbM family methyltransferase